MKLCTYLFVLSHNLYRPPTGRAAAAEEFISRIVYDCIGFFFFLFLLFQWVGRNFGSFITLPDRTIFRLKYTYVGSSVFRPR